MLKSYIIECSKKLGIDGIGFTDAKISDKLKEKLLLQQQLGFNCSFQKGSIEEKTNPKLVMPDCKTIIMILMSYSKTCDKLEKLKDNEVYFSSSSWGTDYHVILKRKLELLTREIIKEYPSLKYKILVDVNPLCERTLAYKSGLGYFGKNNLLINDKYGSYIFLGTILTNLELEKDKPLDKNCRNCDKCVKICPTGAINEQGILNSQLCLSYITQKKGELTDKEKELINNCIYGCDLCIRVCPHNNSNNIKNKEFWPIGIEFINVDTYDNLSTKSFKKRYENIAGSWRGVSIINRNIKIFKDKTK